MAAAVATVAGAAVESAGGVQGVYKPLLNVWLDASWRPTTPVSDAGGAPATSVSVTAMEVAPAVGSPGGAACACAAVASKLEAAACRTSFLDQRMTGEKIAHDQLSAGRVRVCLRRRT